MRKFSRLTETANECMLLTSNVTPRRKLSFALLSVVSRKREYFVLHRVEQKRAKLSRMRHNKGSFKATSQLIKHMISGRLDSDQMSMSYNNRMK